MPIQRWAEWRTSFDDGPYRTPSRWISSLRCSAWLIAAGLAALLGFTVFMVARAPWLRCVVLPSMFGVPYILSELWRDVRRRRALRFLESRKEEPPPFPQYGVEITLFTESFCYGRDVGMLSLVDGWIHFDGLATAFSLKTQDLAQRRTLTGYAFGAEASVLIPTETGWIDMVLQTVDDKATVAMLRDVKACLQKEHPQEGLSIGPLVTQNLHPGLLSGIVAMGLIVLTLAVAASELAAHGRCLYAIPIGLAAVFYVGGFSYRRWDESQKMRDLRSSTIGAGIRRRRALRNYTRGPAQIPEIQDRSAPE